MADPSFPDALPGQHRLHWYVLERVLGQGGFGITYLARDTNLDQAVAIKEYLPVDVATRRADASVRSRTEDQNERYRWGLDRFIREARTLARFDHPNIVRVLSVFEHNNTAYMVMRFEEGENLAALLERRRTLPEEELLRVVLPILDGLELVHNAGFIHRDIKPDNVHIRADGSPVLLDFGSARHALGHARTVTILVAPGYAPFEQYYSSGENQGPWTDLYSLGATCYHAIAGIAPMDAISRSKGILGSTREILVPAATLGSGRYSQGLLKAVDHALQFAEKDRPQSIAEWRRELTAGAEAVARAAPPPIAGTSASAPSPSLRGPIIWATLGALIAAAAVVLWLVPGDQSGKLAAALERSEAERRKLQEEREREVAERQRAAAEDKRLREEQKSKQLEAEQQRLAALENQRTEERLRREAQARREAEATREAQARRKEDAARKAAADRARREEEARLQEAARKLAEAERLQQEKARRAEPVAPPASRKTAEAAPAPDPFALAEQARARGNEVEALVLYRKAADQGNASAQFALGEIFATGRGVPQNNFQAYIWFSLAALAGHAPAGPRRDQAAATLQPAEVQQADAVVRQRREASALRKG